MLRYAGSGAALVAVLVLAGCGSDSESASDQPAVKTIEVTLTDDGCEPAVDLGEGRADDVPRHQRGRRDDVTEFEILQGTTDPRRGRERDAGPRRQLLADPEAGQLRHQLPRWREGDGARSRSPGRPPAPAADPRPVTAAVADLPRRTSKTEADQLVAAAQPFVDAVKAGDVEKAKSLFAAARYHYETIEPIAESFGDLDPEIDAREGDVPEAEWGGFHRIEKALWEAGNTSTAWRPSPTSSWPTCKELQSQIADHRARAGADRQRRGRAAQRGLGVEDHRRGGPLLPHRPVRLRRQRRRRAGRVRRRCGRCSPATTQALADDDRPALRRRRTRRSTSTRTPTRNGNGYVAVHDADPGRHAGAVRCRSTRWPSRCRRSRHW